MAVKYRDGYSSTGRQGAVWLRDVLERPSSQKRVIGARVKKLDGFIEVFADPVQALAPVYSVGRKADGTWQVRGVMDGVGAFQYLGVPTDSVSFTPNFNHYGLRTGFVARLTAGDPATVTDAGGNVWNQATASVLNTPNGRDGLNYFAVDIITNNFITIGASVTSIWYFEAIRSGWYSPAGTPVFYSGYAFNQMASGGQPAHRFVCDDGENLSYGATLGYPNAVPHLSNVSTLAPGHLYKVDRYFRGTTPQLAVFTYSTDAGHTWTAAATPGMFATELAGINALTGSGPDLNKFNTAAQTFHLILAPLSRAQSVMAAVIPYMDSGTLKARVKIASFDVVTHSTGAGVILLDNETPDNALLFLRDLFATPTGVLLLTRPLTPDLDVWSRPARIQRTIDGLSLVDHGALPVIEKRAGPQINGLSTRTMVVTGYDEGAYRLYQSKDWGATWSRRAVISAEGPVPSGDANLTDFPGVVFVRVGAGASNSLPATPWLTDIRVNP